MTRQTGSEPGQRFRPPAGAFRRVEVGPGGADFVRVAMSGY